MTDQKPTTTTWHLDPKIPISIIAGFIFQTLVLGWWASKLDSRVGTTETDIAEIKKTAEMRQDKADTRFMLIERDRERLIRLEADTSYIKESLRRIETKLDPVPARPAP